MKYPKMKSMLVPYINESNDAIRVGGHQMNIAREIEVDDVESFYSLLTMLDGKNSVGEIASKASIPIEELNDILYGLKENGLIYENSFAEYDFSVEEAELYDRNMNFFAWVDVEGIYYNYWQVQNKLKMAHVLLLGAGGTGGQCAKSLVRLGVGEITIIDYDIVELSNLNRQEFKVDDIGKLKVYALKTELEKINPFVNINVKNKKIENLDDLEQLGSNFDIVISCIDKPKNIFEILEKYVSNKPIPWILGGYASTIMNHGIFDKDSMQYTEILNADKNNHFDSKKLFENEFWKWDNAIISPIATISGNISAMYCFYYLTNLKYLKKGYIQHLDFYNVQNMKDFSYMTGDGDTVC